MDLSCGTYEDLRHSRLLSEEERNIQSSTTCNQIYCQKVKQEVGDKRNINQATRNSDNNLPEAVDKIKQELDYEFSDRMNSTDDLNMKMYKADSFNGKMTGHVKLEQSGFYGEDENSHIKDDTCPCIQCNIHYLHGMKEEKMESVHSVPYSELVKHGVFSEMLLEHNTDTMSHAVYKTGEICFPAREVVNIQQLKDIKEPENVTDRQVMAVEYNITQNDYTVTLYNEDEGKQSEHELSISEKGNNQSLSDKDSGIGKDALLQGRKAAGEKPYKCDVCGVGFAERVYLITHRRIHTGEKPYKCDDCGAGFTQCNALNEHKRMHTGEKPYKCDICGVDFARSGTLNTHKRMHTGEKPYKCDICGMDFARSGTLKTHRRVHTGEKPYKCDVCGVAFTHNSTLKAHKRIHTRETPFKCDVCGVSCSQSSALKIHQRIHTGEKPCKCDVCGVAFTHNSTLRTHRKMHTGENTNVHVVIGISSTGSETIHAGSTIYKCDVCSVVFAKLRALKTHRRKHTTEK